MEETAMTTQLPLWDTLPLVCVIWHDAHQSTSSWIDMSESDDEPCIVRTVGWRMPAKYKKGHVCVAQSIEGEHVDNVIAIPKAMVKEVKVLHG